MPTKRSGKVPDEDVSSRGSRSDGYEFIDDSSSCSDSDEDNKKSKKEKDRASHKKDKKDKKEKSKKKHKSKDSKEDRKKDTDKKKKKKRKKEPSSSVNLNEYGKYGIIREENFFQKQRLETLIEEQKYENFLPLRRLQGAQNRSARIVKFRFRFEDVRPFEAESDSQSQAAQFLVVEEIPDAFTARYGTSFPDRIFVRECYKELYDIVSEEMLRGEISTPAYLFTGMPGIGKSVFMLYFLCKHSSDPRFPDKRFAFQSSRRDYYDYFIPTSTASEYMYYSGVLWHDHPISEVMVLVDMSEEQPHYRAKWTLLFGSSNPAQYKEFMKIILNYTFTMPTWSEWELGTVSSNPGWFDRFVICGGVARIVLWNDIGDDDPLSSIDIALEENRVMDNDDDDDDVENFFERGFGNFNPERSYVLVHKNPPFSEELGRPHYGSVWPDHTFASDYVFRQLQSIYTDELVAEEAAKWFNYSDCDEVSQKLGAVSLRHLFEKICLWLVPLSGKTIALIPLSPEHSPSSSISTSSLGYIHLPQMQILDRDWKKLKNLQEGVLYQPQICNLESGDAFCLLRLAEDVLTLVVLQVTVGQRHPVKANGLKHIVQAFHSFVIVRKLIVFVTPSMGQLCEVQPIISQEKEVMVPSSIPIEARNFEQWVYRHVITTNPSSGGQNRSLECVEPSI